MEHGADLIPGDTLPVHRVRARNLSRDSENRIHDDEVARRYGFAGGLVTGTTVYAYLSHPLVLVWGPPQTCRKMQLPWPATTGPALCAITTTRA